MLDHVVKTVFPVHHYQGQPILVREKESRITVHHLLISRFLPVLDDCLKAAKHILCHRHFDGTAAPAILLELDQKELYV